jgi:hypothetical protein
LTDPFLIERMHSQRCCNGDGDASVPRMQRLLQWRWRIGDACAEEGGRHILADACSLVRFMHVASLGLN